MKIAALTLLAIACHELAHVCMALFLGVRVKRVGLWMGISPYIVREPGTDIQNLAISLAGPVASITLGGGALALCPWLGSNGIFFGIASFGIGLFNLLPIPLSDGHRALRLLSRSS